MCVCIYVYLNHFSVHQKLTQHCKSATVQLKRKMSELLLSPVSCESLMHRAGKKCL